MCLIQKMQHPARHKCLHKENLLLQLLQRYDALFPRQTDVIEGLGMTLSPPLFLWHVTNLSSVANAPTLDAAGFDFEIEL